MTKDDLHGLQARMKDDDRDYGVLAGPIAGYIAAAIALVILLVA